jgi:hypothetical protein
MLCCPIIILSEERKVMTSMAVRLQIHAKNQWRGALAAKLDDRYIV